jgi:hypothetical protein
LVQNKPEIFCTQNQVESERIPRQVFTKVKDKRNSKVTQKFTGIQKKKLKAKHSVFPKTAAIFMSI